ncbi:hypothetical protein [Pseudophaeobacter leonis]|uniref:hypothetical protein n=1 Tax=Pseudophaeobacter leonis TaxID=1144477 RepID=UPI0030C6BEE8
MASHAWSCACPMASSALDQSGRAASLKINSPAAVFDTSRVFDLIPRDRLQALSQNGAGQPLRLELGCDCEISSYLQRDGYLVLDIADGNGAPVQASLGSLSLGQPVEPARTPPSPAGYRFNLSQGAIADARFALNLKSVVTPGSADTARQPAEPEPPAETTNEIAAGSARMVEPEPVGSRGSAVLAAGLDAELGLNQPQTEEPEVTTDLASNEADAAPADLPEVNLLIDLEETSRAATVNASESRLLQQIGRAANQGLVDIALADRPESEGGRALELLGRSDRPLNPLDNISVTSAIDRETGLVAERNPKDSTNDHCLPDRRLAIHSWGSDEPFADQLGPMRAALVREFDDINPASVRALAKLYLYFGFGAEARAMLTMLPADPVPSKKQAMLLAMADLLDGESLGINHPFSGQQGCDGAAAFWAALADDNIRKTANTDAIQQTFAKLPVHLRVNFGPQLSSLFAKAGDLHVAEAILRSVSGLAWNMFPKFILQRRLLPSWKAIPSWLPKS